MEGKVISTSFVESAVVNAPVSAIWPFIKLKEFGKFYSAIQKVETIPGERETVKWYFENDTILTLQEEEYSVSMAPGPRLLICLQYQNCF